MNKHNNTMKQVIIILLALLFVSCSGSSDKQPINTVTLNVGDSITTIDNVSYYWMQISDDSAKISAVKNGDIVNECLVTGPVYGAVAAEEKPFSERFFYILCGEDQYQLFDTRNIPNEINLMTEDDLENYNIEDEEADLIINL